MRHAEPYVDCTTCAVRADNFCSAVPLRGLGGLVHSRQVERFERRQTIISEGGPASSFFNIVSGVVKLCRSLADGRTQIIGFRFPGEAFGVSDTGTYTATVEALTPVELCRFPKARLNGLMQAFPPVQEKLLEMNYRYMGDYEDQIFLLGRKTARERVASFLLGYGDRFSRGMRGPDRGLGLPVTRAEIADFLGLTTETVSRILTSLVREKIIVIGAARSIHLLDTFALQRISGD